MTIPIIRGLSELSADYDGFILDIWGVIHQGGDAYPEAIDCVRQLRDAGKRVVFLSNAPRRAETVAQIIEDKGIPRELYGAILSSGEAARISFEAGDEAPLNTLGRRYYLLAASGDDGLLDGLDIHECPQLIEAIFDRQAPWTLVVVTARDELRNRCDKTVEWS